MKTTGDQYLVKKINSSLVLDTILSNAPISRANVAEITQLNKGTVSNLVHELIENHLVYEIGTGESSGGRKPVLLLFNKHAGYTIGVDLRVHELLTVLTNLEGEIVQERLAPLTSVKEEDVLKLLCKEISEMIALAPPSPHGIVGIGIGVPGIVDEAGAVLFAPHLQWRNVPLKSMLDQHFPYPVYVDNEANAGAIGEKKFGAGRTAANLIFASVGTGIGTGIIINGSLFRGASGFSGEMGHMTIEAFGPLCACGNHGCWELYASEQALFTQTNLLQANRDPLSVHHIQEAVARAERNDTEIIDALQRIGSYLGIGMANIINIFNPELIIIGNRMTQAEPWIRDPILSVLNERSLPFHHEQVKLTFSTLGLYSTALGAADFAISGFLSSIKVVSM